MGICTSLYSVLYIQTGVEGDKQMTPLETLKRAIGDIPNSEFLWDCVKATRIDDTYTYRALDEWYYEQGRSDEALELKRWWSHLWNTMRCVAIDGRVYDLNSCTFLS